MGTYITVDRLGIIPAGGSAFRFGGVLKELLPVANHVTAMSRLAEELCFCSRTVVLTTRDKMPSHAHALRDFPNVVYEMSGKTMWESIVGTFDYGANRNYLGMPDTVFSNGFDIGFLAPLVLGTFVTEMPERFGVISDNGIIDKRNLPGLQHIAWGTIMWRREVTEFWKDGKYSELADALSSAMGHFGYNRVEMDSYHDFASMRDYSDWIRSWPIQP